MGKVFKVTSRHSKFDVLDGYSCISKSKNHFIRHLSHKFYKYFMIFDLDNAVASHDIVITESDKVPKTINDISKTEEDIAVNTPSNEYWDDYGYVLEFEDGESIYTQRFVNDVEAREWLESQK